MRIVLALMKVVSVSVSPAVLATMSVKLNRPLGATKVVTLSAGEEEKVTAAPPVLGFAHPKDTPLLLPCQSTTFDYISSRVQLYGAPDARGT